MIVSFLDRRGFWEKHNISAWGPILMIRTTKGLEWIDKAAKPKRFWRLFANIGIVLMFIGMIFMFALVLASDYALVESFLEGSVMEPGKYNELKNIFLIPGVNDFIPFTWGLLALVVTLVVHEFSHSILARVEGIRVKSMGILLAIIPIGGFAEPDEEELFGGEIDFEKQRAQAQAQSEYNDMTASIEEIRAHEAQLNKETEAQAEKQMETEKQTETEEQTKTESQTENTNANEKTNAKTNTKTKPKVVATNVQRSRVLSAGVMANFCIALVAFILFFGPVLGGITTIGSLQITDIDNNSPAAIAGLSKDMVIVSINGQTVTDPASINESLKNVAPGDSVVVSAAYDRVITDYTLKTNANAENVNYAGIYIQNVVSGSPAESAGIESGMVITKADGVYVPDVNGFSEMLSTKKPGDTIVLTAETFDENGHVVQTQDLTITLGQNPNDASRAYMGISYTSGPLHIGLLGFSVGQFNAATYLDILNRLPSMLFDLDFSDISGSLKVMLAAWIYMMALPFFGLTGEGFSGFSGSMMQFYAPTGWAEPLGIGIFWIANALFWIAWLNFYVGLFNCLPANPLDGGHVFRAMIQTIGEKFKMSSEKAARLAGKICFYLSIFIFGSFIFMFIWPFIGKYFLTLLG
ncbi:site-2 protease family protein [Methanolapillus africanus]